MRKTLLSTLALSRRLAVRLSLEAAVPTARPEFVVEDANHKEVFLYQPYAVSGRAALGLELRFY